MSTPKQDIERRLEDPECAKCYGAELAKTEFGIILALAREKAGMSQTDIGRLVDISELYVNWVEKGDANLSLALAGKLLAVLGLRLKITAQPLRGDDDGK